MGDIVLLGTDIHLPWWFPGASFKKDADTYKRRLDQSRDLLHEAVEKALVRTILQLRPRFFLNCQPGGKQGCSFHRSINDY